MDITGSCETVYGSIKYRLFLLVFGLFFQSATAQKSRVDSILALPIDSTLSWMNKNYDGEIGVYPEVARRAILKVQKNKNYELIGDFHAAYAAWQGYNGIYPQDSLIFQSEQVLANYLKTGHRSKIASAYRSLALDYLNNRRFEDAEKMLFKSLPIYEELEDQVGLAKVFRTLGISYNFKEEPENAIRYLNKAAPILEKAGSYNSLSYTYLSYIEAYILAKDYEKAQSYIDRSFRLVAEKVPEEIFVKLRIHSFQGDLHIERGAYKEALEDYTKAHKIAADAAGEERAKPYLNEIGRAHLKLGNYNRALTYLKSALEGFDQKQFEEVAEPFENIALCYEKLGDYKNALFYANKASVATQNLLKGNIKSLKTELTAKYESGKKDQALTEQEKLIKQKSRTQNIAFGSVGILALLLGGLYISFRKNQEKTKLITAKNEENELLLKEIHHRVKNNLELVKSLIALQSAELEDSATKDAMIASQNRVQSMGIIHQKLYQGTNLGNVEMKDYFVDLSEGILDSFNAKDRVKINCIMDDLELDIDTAVPIGLIVNELLTNALKYAFPEKRAGEIRISMSRTKDDIIELNVSDNGIGKQPLQKTTGTGFGTRLVQLLTQQLNGVMKEQNQHGTLVSFTFNIDAAA